jgi:signal transduction histidine kinase
MPECPGRRGRVSVAAVSLRGVDLGRRPSSSSSLAGAHQLRRALSRDRGRVADVLHAEIAQELAAAIMELGLVAGALAPASLAAHERDKLRAGLERTEILLRKCVRGVAALETSLRPPLLARAGLLAALRWFAETEAGEGAALTLDLPLSLPRAAVEAEQDLFDSVAAIVRDGLRHGRRRALRIQVAPRTLVFAMDGVASRGLPQALVEARARLDGVATVTASPRSAGATTVQIQLGRRGIFTS